MANNNQIQNLNTSGSEASPSKIDLFSGKHTTSLIVAFMFLFTLLGFLIVYCLKDDIKDTMITGMFGILSLLAGFFAGTQMKKGD